MSRKVVLVVGASGIVGYAAMRHFRTAEDCEVIAVSRRRPDETFGARHIPLDLTDTARCAEIFGSLPNVTHVVYCAVLEGPRLTDGWRNAEQIAVNDRMLRNVMEPLEKVARNLRHVALLQGTKAYGVHVRPMRIPAREGRSELREEPNFYWEQEDYLTGKQRGKDWSYSILRPVLIVGYALGSVMNLISAIGVYAAMLREAGQPLHFPGGPSRVGQAVDADLLARCIAWAGEAPAGRNEVFNVANGDVFCFENVWPAIADAVGMQPGGAVPCSLVADIEPQEEAWSRIRSKYGLAAGDLKSLVGLSFQYADYQMGFGRTTAPPPTYSSTIKLRQAGFHEVMDTEAMFVKWLRIYQERKLLPPR
jgi:nucleoside-diphosphate-sugar epimerase